MTLEILTIEQGTPEWHAARAGVITASDIHNVMAEGRKGEPSKTRDQYMRALAAEIVSGRPCIIFEGNKHTERGKEEEAEARNLYTMQTGAEVKQVGFVKNGRYGCSPDALVGDDGGAEIKSRRGDIQVKTLLEGRVPPENMKQIQFSLFVTGRQWWDYVSYSPQLPLFVQRVFPDMEMQMEMKAALHFFQMELDQMVAKLSSL